MIKLASTSELITRTQSVTAIKLSIEKKRFNCRGEFIRPVIQCSKDTGRMNSPLQKNRLQLHTLAWLFTLRPFAASLLMLALLAYREFVPTNKYITNTHFWLVF